MVLSAIWVAGLEHPLNDEHTGSNAVNGRFPVPGRFGRAKDGRSPQPELPRLADSCPL